ncbi:protein LURP-one-related 15-like isoform X2 [Cornus florida]|uniref:protein LURP-one-related 15-like isoform X2 n=1 Tax=Cornus florida TaxID=4283 RepID=UPI002898C705|nr:protein LURP-one-related 15-like isoform X2 [Cornus florida]
MAQPSYAPLANPISIIGPQFCVPNPVDLAIVRKMLAITDGNFVVTDLNDNLMFKLKEKIMAIHDRLVLLDAAGKPIVTLQEKIWTAHSRWQVFRGDSKDPADLLFSAKTSSIIQLKTKLNVYLANNTAEEMHKKHTVESVLLGKDKFMVTVYPNVDYAFIVALIVILDDINKAGES